ncbi:MAG: hypothetical protein KC519_08040, partial [Anaerolineae bacterium]|nr:hypothetical protein [Anaerolineae bacterium]
MIERIEERHPDAERTRLRLALLGTPQIALAATDNLTHEVVIKSDKALALLTFLAVERHKAHDRTQLATLLWSNSTDQNARQSLRQALYTLRKALAHTADAMLQISEQTVRINDDEGALWLDAERFSALNTDSLAELQDSAQLYRGEFLEGLTLPESEPFEDWLRLKRVLYEQHAVLQFSRLTERLIDEGDFASALPTAERLLAFDPTAEASHRYLMRIYAGLGNLNAVRSQYTNCERILQAEVGSKPEGLTRKLLRDLLEHVAPHHVPTPTHPLVGRRRELEQLGQIIRQHGSRLITISGPGGIGKT